MDLQLRGKVAMLTGASRGLGRAMAQALAAEGVRLSICARGAEALEQAAVQFKAGGAEVLAQPTDVCDSSALRSWTQATVKQFGGVDILVNNAGGARVGTLNQVSEEAWQQAFEVNFFSAVRLSRLCASEMEKRGGGAIINISSIYGREAGGPLTYELLQGRNDLVHQDAGARAGAASGARQLGGTGFDSLSRRDLGEGVSGQSRVREGFRLPRFSGRTARQA